MNAPLTPSAFEPRGKWPPPRRSPRLRLWAVRHARLLEAVYAAFERALVFTAPLAARIGWKRLERPFARFERAAKGTLFDCRMCGQCALSSTGLSCAMNCPKALRNGPCGGVREDGCCEVYPDMPCVWVAAYEGSLRMRHGARLAEIQPPLDNRLKGASAWLAVMRASVGGGRS